jgi:transposase
MSKPLIDDELWVLVEPLLPEPKARRFDHPGRKPLEDRAVLNGIVFVLKTGIDWDDLPAELGWGCGKTCRACGCATGIGLECGKSCTPCCFHDCAEPTS